MPVAGAPSWTLNGSTIDDGSNSQDTRSLAFDSALDFEETDSFNPNGLANGGHKRTYSFNGPKSPVKTPVRSTYSSHLRQGSGYALSPISAAFPEHTRQDTPTRPSHSNSTHGHSHTQSHDHSHAHSHSHSHGHSHSHSQSVAAPPPTAMSIDAVASPSRFEALTESFVETC